MEMFTSPSASRGRRPDTPQATRPSRWEGLPEVAPAAQWQPATVKPLHELLADLVMTQPGLTAAELGAKVGRHPVTVRLILRSDLFRELLAQRRQEVVDPRVTAKVEELLDVTISTSLEVLSKSVEESQSTELALKTLAAVGPMSKYGARTPPPAVQANFIVPMPPKAASTAEWEARVAEVRDGG